MIKFDLDLTPSSKKFLESFPHLLDKALLQASKKSSVEVEGSMKERFGKPGSPRVRTGDLRRSIKGYSKKIGDKYIVGAGTKKVYAPPQEFGAIIRAKTSPYLHFKIGESWVKTKQVVIPARPFMAPGLEDAIPKVKAIFEREVEKALEGRR